MPDQEQTGSRFIVDLGNVKLPALVERQVEAEIQAIVLRELAENPFDAHEPVRQRNPTIWETFPDQTRGLWPTYPKNPPAISGAGPAPFTVQDHTLIMNAIMENALQVIRKLPASYKSRTGTRPTGTVVLEAALKVNGIDNAVKARIREMLPIGRKLEESASSLPKAAKHALDDLRQRLARETGRGKIRVLRDPNNRNRIAGVDLTNSMEIAAQILEDGESSIYSPDHGFYKMLQRSSATARPIELDIIEKLDGGGSLFGSVAGPLFAPELGELSEEAGGAAGATIASAGAVIGIGAAKLWDFLTADDDDDDADVEVHGHGHGHTFFDDDYPDS